MHLMLRIPFILVCVFNTQACFTMYRSKPVITKAYITGTRKESPRLMLCDKHGNEYDLGIWYAGTRLNQDYRIMLARAYDISRLSTIQDTRGRLARWIHKK